MNENKKLGFFDNLRGTWLWKFWEISSIYVFKLFHRRVEKFDSEHFKVLYSVNEKNIFLRFLFDIWKGGGYSMFANKFFNFVFLEVNISKVFKEHLICVEKINDKKY